MKKWWWAKATASGWNILGFKGRKRNLLRLCQRGMLTDKVHIRTLARNCTSHFWNSIVGWEIPLLTVCYHTELLKIILLACFLWEKSILSSQLSLTLLPSKAGGNECGCRIAWMPSCFWCCVQDLLTANLIWRVIDNKYNNLREKSICGLWDSRTSQAYLCSLSHYTPYSVSYHCRR